MKHAPLHAHSWMGPGGKERESVRKFLVQLTIWPGLLEAWYHGNLYILIPLNQRLALTRLRATGPWCLHATVVYAKNRNHYTQHVPTSVFKIYKLNWIIFLFSGIITLWCHFLNSFFKHLVCIFTNLYLCLRLWVTDRTFQNLWWNILLNESRVYKWF